MSVPVFEDLGKSASDIFRTGFNYDQAKLKVVGNPKDVGVECDGVYDLKSHKVFFLLILLFLPFSNLH